MSAPAAPDDLGLGRLVMEETRGRLLNRDGSANTRKYGISGIRWQHLHQRILGSTWPRFLIWSLAIVFLVNGVFALGYVSIGSTALAGAEDVGVQDPFLAAFFFGLGRFTLVGLGRMHPVGLEANWLAALQSLLGAFAFMACCALVVARLTRPRATVRFSESAVIAPYQGGRAFMFRIINMRPSELIDVKARVNLAWIETVGDKRVRRFHQLALERSSVEFFTLNWTIVHPITAASPLAGVTPETLRASAAEFVVLITGLEESFSTMVNARSSYVADEVRWDAKFADMRVPSIDERVTVDVDRLDRFDRLDEGATATPAAKERAPA